MTIEQYRNEVLNVLKSTNNHYDTKVLNINIGDYKINYHKWLHPYQGDWEYRELFTPAILKNLSKIISNDSVVIDIGAQAGNMSVAYSLFAEKVLSFEPNPATFEVLSKNAELNTNIIPFNYAVSDEEGPLTFHYSDYGFCNGGFATRTDVGIGVTGHVIPIDVMAINLEKFINENDIKLNKISLIKIDAEGHDRFILKNIKNIIDRYSPVIITEIYNGLSLREMQDLLDTIHSLGYRAYDEKTNLLDIDNLGSEIKTINDINPQSGHNLICVK